MIYIFRLFVPIMVRIVLFILIITIFTAVLSGMERKKDPIYLLMEFHPNDKQRYRYRFYCGRR